MVGSDARNYLSLRNQTGNQRIWGGETLGGIGKPFINTDGSFIFEIGGPLSYFRKLNSDSSLAWQHPLDGTFGSLGSGFKQLIYLTDSSAIGVGSVFFLTSQSHDFYFCRITNVGVPYDPTIIISTQPKIKGVDLIPYPNPTESSLVFKGLKEEGQLYLFNLKGQVVKQMEIKPYQRVYLNDLPAGLYPYRVQTKKGHHVGRVVRN